MLAILILASITAIALSLSTIVFIETRSSADLKNTEPNLYATLGLTEMALFKEKRGVSGTDLNIVDCGKSSIGRALEIARWWCKTSNGVTLSIKGNSTLTQYEAPRILVVPAKTTVNIPLYFYANQWVNEFARVDIKAVSAISPNQILIRLNEIPASPIDPNVPVIRQDPADGGLETNKIVSKTTSNAKTQYELEIYNSTNIPKTIALYSYKKDTLQLYGLPYLGNVAYDVVAKSFNLTRIYRVQIPLP